MGQRCCTEMPYQPQYNNRINGQRASSPTTVGNRQSSPQSPSLMLKPQISFAASATERKLGQYRPTKSFDRGLPSQPIALDQQGTIYVGEMKNGVPMGLGKLYLPNGSYFNGTFRDGLPDGQGRFITKDGIYYEGEVAKGQADGNGKSINHMKGYSYQGQWHEDIPEGKGKQVWTGLSQYEGDFRRGVKQGKGVYKRLGQYQYEGQFLEGQFQGSGIIHMQNGESYEGEWKQGKFNGYGSYRWPDQTYYTGFFKQGMKHGEGKFTGKDGQLFEGVWENGKRNGKGRLQKQGKIIQGQWINDIFSKKSGPAQK